MDNHLILQLIEIAVAILSFAYGVRETYKRRRTEKVMKIITKTYPGDVAKIEQSCTWAWSNVRNAHDAAIKIADSEEKQSLLHFLGLAIGDTAASARMCTGLFNQLLSFQEAQFGTRDITHPERRGLALVKAESENSTETTAG